MATVTIKHASITGAAANPAALVDGPKWDATHTVTGLENVDNTSDVNKPVSTAQAAAIAAAKAAAINYGPNVLKNSGLGLTSQISTVLVGSRVQITGFAQQGGAGSGNVRFTTSGGNAGLQAGKLVAILGNATASLSFTATVTGGNTITATSSVFTQSQGDLIWITGGSNSSPRTQYKVITAVSGTQLVLSAGLANESGVTFTATAIQGGYAVDATVNGMPAAGNPNAPAFFYYPLQVTAVGTNFFDAQMAGHDLNVGTTSTASAYEVTNGCQGTGFVGPDWWSGTASISFFKMRGTDWNGSTVVNMPGSLYSAKLVKGSTAAEYFWQDLSASNPAFRDVSNPVGLATLQGRTVTFGAYIWTPNASQGRLFIYDGSTFTFSANVTPGSFQWVEISATLSSNLTAARAGIILDAGSIGDTFFFTQPDVRYGSASIGAGNYKPAPASMHMFVNHNNPFLYVGRSVPTSTYINIEQETCGLLPSGMEAIHADIGGFNNTSVSSIYLADAPANAGAQMSAIVAFNPAISATLGCNQTGIAGVSRRAAGDGLGFYIDSHYIQVNSSGWTGVTVDYLGGIY